VQKTPETVNDVASLCVDTSNQLRRFLFSGHEMAWSLRRDVATLANLLVDLGSELGECQQSGDETAKLLENTTKLGGSHPIMIPARSG
jgi:hypothetical protein